MWKLWRLKKVIVWMSYWKALLAQLRGTREEIVDLEAQLANLQAQLAYPDQSDSTKETA